MTSGAGRRGHALIGTMIFLVLGMLLWTAAHHKIAGYLRVEKTHETREERSVNPKRAMAWSLALLETGLPPEDPYACRMVPNAETGKTYVATFTAVDTLKYSISIRPATEDDVALPLAPETFQERRRPPRRPKKAQTAN